MTVTSRPVEHGAPVVQKLGPVAWSQKHLFNSWFNSLLTVLLTVVLGLAAFGILKWIFGGTDWSVVSANFGQFMSGLYKPELYWRIWSIFGLIMLFAGLSWGVLARNQKTLLSRPVLIGLGAIALFLILFPLTRPHALLIIGGEILLVAMAFVGQAFGRKVPNAASLLSIGWFSSYFVVLYLLGGGEFRESFLYGLFMLGAAGVAGWLLMSNVNSPAVTKWLGVVAVIGLGVVVVYQTIRTLIYLPYYLASIAGILQALATLAALIVMALGSVGWVRSPEASRRWGNAFLFLVAFAAMYALLWWLPYQLGLDFGLRNAPTSGWGGMSLTLLLAVSGIALCFPAGVLLALGRRSKLPVLRGFSVAYIELVRGVPLISILFMGQVLIPLFLPAGMRPDRVVRAVIGLTIFSSAYLAENVRAGLQAVPQGQVEAAQSLGLSKPLSMALIVLPQALKTAIPAIVGQFISLFQDTTLLGIVGLVELLGITQNLLANPKYLGDYAQGYVFIALLYWIFCYAMSYGSRRVEESLNTDLR